jgi:F0F1-type ATP synthase epsilon subunit
MADDVTAPDENAAATPKTAGGKPTLAIKVYAPFKVYYEGEGYSVSAINETGPFDILPGHQNFLSMLIPCTLVIQTPDGQKDINITRALVHVNAGRVVVFMDV